MGGGGCVDEASVYVQVVDVDLIAHPDHSRTGLVLGAAVTVVASVVVAVVAVVARSARGDFAVFSFGEEIDASSEKY